MEQAQAALCDEDFHVVNHACVACPSGQSNLRGDDPNGQDTTCDTCRITTNQELRDHVDSWIADPSNHPCGPVIGEWEVGRVTDMSYVFCADNSMSKCNTNRRNFNADISKWNIASATSLSNVFHDVLVFTGDGVSNWDTSRVTSLYAAFRGATSFTGDGLSNWDTSRVTDLMFTFYSATSFNGDLSSWDTSKVTDISYTFSYATSFSGYGLQYWNVSQSVINFEPFADVNFSDGTKKCIYDSWTSVIGVALDPAWGSLQGDCLTTTATPMTTTTATPTTTTTATPTITTTAILPESSSDDSTKLFGLDLVILIVIVSIVSIVRDDLSIFVLHGFFPSF